MNTKEGIFQRLLAFLKKKALSFKKNANIVRELVKKNIKVQYRNSVIGALWTVLNPLLNMLVMFFVFSVVLNYGSEKTYALYILCGNIMFSFVRAATTQSLPSIVQNRGLLTKNKISQYVFPISSNLVAVVNFGFSSIALLGVMAVVSIIAKQSFFSFNLLLIFLMLPALFLFSYGLSLILAALYVFFRDIQHFYNVFLTLWTYLTPVFWKVGNVLEVKEGDTEAMELLIKPLLKIIVHANPMYHFVTYFRDIAYGCVENGVSVWQTFPLLGTLYLIGLIFAGIGMLVFSLTRSKFIYYI
ncbi:MAG: ABC transporter permease [Clostridia bacterium]|nr:ABC transporter permease [Clostridia bacterium]